VETDLAGYVLNRCTAVAQKVAGVLDADTEQILRERCAHGFAENVLQSAGTEEDALGDLRNRDVFSAALLKQRYHLRDHPLPSCQLLGLLALPTGLAVCPADEDDQAVEVRKGCDAETRLGVTALPRDAFRHPQRLLQLCHVQVQLVPERGLPTEEGFDRKEMQETGYLPEEVEVRREDVTVEDYVEQLELAT